MPLTELTEAQLEQIAEHVAYKLAHTRQPRTPWDRRWNLAVTVIAVTSFVFSVGVNWSRMDTNERGIAQLAAREDRHDADLRDLRSELASERAANLVVLAKLDAIQVQITDIKSRFDKAFR